MIEVILWVAASLCFFIGFIMLILLKGPLAKWHANEVVMVSAFLISSALFAIAARIGEK